jgi:hypothetical protein
MFSRAVYCGDFRDPSVTDTLKETCCSCGRLFVLRRMNPDADVLRQFPVLEFARVGPTVYEIYAGTCEGCEETCLRVVDVADGVVHYPRAGVGYVNRRGTIVRVPPPNLPLYE